MDKNFRDKAYASYVSSFKTSQESIDDLKMKKLHEEYKYRLLPLVETLAKSSPILELGCGPGYLLKYLMKQGFNDVTGIDISKEQLEIAHKMGLKVIHGDALEFLSEENSCYKAIIAIDFVEHFDKNEIFDLFHRISSALIKDGILIIQTPNGQGLFPGQVIYGDLTHLTILGEDSLRHLLQYHGFGNIQFYETSPIPNDIEGKFRFVAWQIIRAIIRLCRQIEAKNTSKIWTENMICASKKIK